MGAEMLSAAKATLTILKTALDIAPIPDPFKSAVTAIPEAALNIIDIAEVGRR